MGKGIKPNGIYLRSLDPRILEEFGDLGNRFLLISVPFVSALTIWRSPLDGRSLPTCGPATCDPIRLAIAS